MSVSSLSVFDLFKIGIGPSSSHTVGPMRAASMFVERIRAHDRLNAVARVKAEMFGSLGATGHGHGTPGAVMLGLEGEKPETVDVDAIKGRIENILEIKSISLLGAHAIKFDGKTDLLLHRRKSLPLHPNGMRFTAFDAAGSVLEEGVYYSVGGGFVVDDDAAGDDRITADARPLTYPFNTALELLEQCGQNNLSISDVMLANETAWRSEEETRTGLLEIWGVMQSCVERACASQGVLPGGLNVKRRAVDLYARLSDRPHVQKTDSLITLDWITLFALAVNEENAAGGRVVTAPTNGAAGIVPAVLHYYVKFIDGANEEGVIRFLLTAAAIGILFKKNASISGAEVGCQGEVGSACSMAAGALAEMLGGTPMQVENAAEIAMEHNLGLTCDPVGGLVQVPCIERNAVAAVKAIHAARMALNGDGEHFVSLDKVIKTMRDTGRDMKEKYKETSRGGLAVNVIEC